MKGIFEERVDDFQPLLEQVRVILFIWEPMKTDFLIPGDTMITLPAPRNATFAAHNTKMSTQESKLH